MSRAVRRIAATLVATLVLATGLAFLPGPGLAEGGARTALADRIVARIRADYGGEFPQGVHFVIEVSPSPGDVSALAEFWMDPKTGRFLVNAVRSGGHVQRLEGVAAPRMEVAVPDRAIAPGEIIAGGDLRVKWIDPARLGAFAMPGAGSLVGREAVRLLPEGRIVRRQSVAAPRAVERGERIEIAYADGALRLVAPGRALGDAERGQDVRVLNLASHKTIWAVASGDGRVTVAAAPGPGALQEEK